MKSTLLKNESDLPSAVRRHLRDVGSPNGGVFLAARTSFRVNSDMPFAWLVVTHARLAVVSTHKSRGLHRNHGYSEINEIRFDNDSRRIDVLLNNPTSGDFDVQVPGLNESEFGELRDLLSKLISMSRFD
jgi:hypothetical protein